MTDRRETVLESIRRRIVRGLRAGSLHAGMRLPSARELARELEVDHRAVLQAYRTLAEEGTVELRARGGVYLSLGTVDGVPVPADRWLVELLVQANDRGIPVADFPEWLRRATRTLRLRVAVLHSIPDQLAGMCRELGEDYGLDASGIDLTLLPPGVPPSGLPDALRFADLLVTTPLHEAEVRALSDALGRPMIVVDVRPDLVGEDWRELLRDRAFAVVADARFEAVIREFFRNVPGGDNLRVLVLGRDELDEIPPDAPVYVTRGARERLGNQTVPGRLLPTARIFAEDAARALLGHIVRENIAAFTAQDARRH